MDLFHYERFDPEIGENRKLPVEQRLFLEVACGMTKVQLTACKRALELSSIVIDADAAKAEAATTGEPVGDVALRMTSVACVDRIATAWAPYVRVGAGPRHTLNGVTVASLRDYVAALIEQPGVFNLVELSQVIAQLNSVTGTRALFSERLSGGPIFTAGQRTDADVDATGSR